MPSFKNTIQYIFIIFLFFFGVIELYSENNTILIGYQVATDLIIDEANTGNEGISYEILKKIEEKTNLTFDFVEVKGDIFNSLRNNEVDMIGLYFKSPERESEFLYAEKAFNTVISGLATKGNQGVFYDDPQSINGKTVAAYYGSPAVPALDQYLEENNISVEYKYASLDRFLDLDADYYIMASSVESPELYYTILNLMVSETYLVTNYENADIMNIINEAYNEISIEEGFYIRELLDKYNHDAVNLTHRGLTREECKILQQRPLQVGFIENHQPFTYKDENGNAAGVLVELMDKLASENNFEVEYHPYNLSEEESLHKDFDILISLLGNTRHELTYYEPTEVYYQMPMVATVPIEKVKPNQTRDEIIAQSKRIGISQYLYTDFSSFYNTFPNHSVVFYDSFTEMLSSYTKGDIDMAVYTSTGSTYVDAYIPHDNEYLFATDFSLNFHFSIAKPIASEYIPIFNVMFDRITPREYEDIFISNSVYYPEYSLLTFIKKYWAVFAIFILVMAMIFIIYHSRVREQKNKLMLKAYQTDTLTGLHSHTYFYEEAQEIISKSKPNEYKFISFDIDYFRTINSYFSMEYGTDVIIAIAESLKKAFAGTPTLFSRKTAENFFILKKVEEGDTIKYIHDTYILPSIRAVLGSKYNVSLSFGTTIVEDCNEKLSDIVAHADYARLTGKSIRETTFAVFDNIMKKNYNSILNITFNMEKAVENKEFEIYYQPKVNLQTLKICGGEALIRWIPPHGNMVYPSDFIEVFEKNGFISIIDIYVFRHVCDFICKNKGNQAIPPLSVNISTVTLLEPTLIPQLLTILAETNIEAYELELEITETAILGAEEKFIEKIKQLKKVGFKVSIDDFGSGVSSLNRLCSIDADVLKLDRVFFEYDEENEKSRIIIDEIITMAKRLKMNIIAEGVETAELALFLQSLGCDSAQGYYFSKPISERDFFALIEMQNQYSLELAPILNNRSLFSQ